MKTRNLLMGLMAAMALLATQMVSSASVVTLTSEGLQDLEPILNFYDGGLGGFGTGPGPSYGIQFTSDSLAIIASDSGGTGNFTGALAPSPHTLAFFLSGAGDTMNVAAGFTTGFSFYYTSPFNTGTVSVWDGLNGTGTLLASLTLGTTTDTSGTTGHPYDDWHAQGVTFSGAAQSVIFSGVANYIGFDNITLGSETPLPAVPEPSTCLAAALLLLPFGASLIRKLRKA
jgi:hypothetical protein